MALSKRQRVLAAVVTRLQAITQVNGFQTDCGEAIVVGRTPELGPDDPDDAIAVIPQDVTSRKAGPAYLLDWPISIQAISKEDLDDVGLRIEAVLADIKSAMELDDRRFDGLIAGDMERSAERRLEMEPDSPVLGAEILYTLQLKESWGGAA